MQTILSRLGRSAAIKGLTIAGLILMLLIPLGMIKGTINDRNQVNQSAQQDIQRTWGQSQLVAGPILVLPYDTVRVNGRGEQFTDRTEMYVLPATLNLEASVESETRYRGIHKVPVYAADIRLHGQFGALDAETLGIDDASVHWDEASLVVGISDGRAISETPSAVLNGESIKFGPGGVLIEGLPPQIQAPLPDADSVDPGEALAFEISLSVKGSNSLSFLPLGDTTWASIESAWPSPSFAGNYLPIDREISDDGFSARWQVSSIGRALPSRWAKGSNAAASAHSAVFGVDLYLPISVYRLTLRAATYGVLFVALTFVSYFLFEVIAGLRLHPLQYLMVGLANLIFFLLLTSLAEHIGFGWSYILSACASSGLIVSYSASILGQRSRAGVIAGVLLVLYCFLYMTLKAATYALLAGSIGLWVALALVMYLTRRIDWYELSNEADDKGNDRQGDLLLS
ncbi:MAG: cell envelope integrity protein CreD [Pseudomonadota bacterium]